jgi:hypothetical protein
MAQLDGAASGHYVAEADLLAADTRARRSFTAPTWDRLEDLRARVDPDGLFATFLGPPVGATTSPQSSHSHESSPR